MPPSMIHASNVEKGVDQSLREIDEEIHRLNLSIRELKIRRNSLAAIFKLPPEVLTEIFLFVAPTYPAHPTVKWIRSITHICTHWRLVALETSMLWSNICFETRKELTMEMFRRSRDTPLVIRAEISDDPYTGRTRPSTLVNYMRGRISNTRILHVTLRGYEDEHAPTYAIREIIAMLNEPSPVLQTLHLQESALSNKGVSIPPNVFHIQEHLTTLELVNITLDWCALPEALLQRLIRLSVADTRTDSPRAELHDVLGAMERMGNLETFRLALYALPAPPIANTSHKPLPFSFQAAVARHRPIRLPKLAELRLKGTLRDISCFLRYISPPTTAPLSVDIDCLKLLNPMARPEDMSSVLSFVNACFNVGHPQRANFAKSIIKPLPLLPNATPLRDSTRKKQPIQRLVITDHAGDIFSPHIEFMGWTGSTGYKDNSRAQMNISFRWDSDPDRSLVPGTLTNVCGMLPLGWVQSLTVEYSQLIPRGLWMGLFSQMKEISTLCLYGEKAALELPIALVPPEYHDDPVTAAVLVGISGSGGTGDFIGEGRGYDMYLPKLGSLEITRMGFTRTDTLMFQRLRDCLTEREVGNVGVQNVTIYGWKDVRSELMTQLQDLGVKMAVDPDSASTLDLHRFFL